MEPRPTVSAAAPQAGSPLAAAVVAAAVARIEQEGALDDNAALRQAWQGAATRAEQVRLRAWLLGERLGLVEELARWRHLTGWVVLALALALALAGFAAGRGVLAADRSINAVAAFVGLLGLHALTLLLWLAGVLALRWGAGAAAGGCSLGRVALGLTARLPPGRGRHAPALWAAFNEVLRRERLWPWLTGALSHTVWALSLTLTLAVLAFGFAFQAYRLSWETTILSADFFERFVRWTGALPAALGFPMPDADSVRLVGQAGASGAVDQRGWAWWLMGCVAVYGVLPRALLAAFSGWRWRARVARLPGVDMGDPAVQRIVRRLDALEPPPEVLDPEQPGADAVLAWPRAAGDAAAGAPLVVGFELAPEQPWPLPELARWRAVRLAGSAAEREALLAHLAAQPPSALLVVVQAASSPDRGSARFLREVGAAAARTALWPLGETGAERWRAWLDSEHFSDVALVDQAQAATHWIAQEVPQ
ncbi:MAG: DUF2868 domain-containing protein [Comamonadaceae bacterium]|nr:DUF2868 domain-containing protein [Burkholderiales bacterium]MEB2348053.1 DUF2868 domain-containing protein [Comamonadaceae bacterium]